MKLIVEDYIFPIALTDDEKSMSERDFFEFCQRNPELRLERDADGNVILMSPVTYKGANFEALLIGLVQAWASKCGKGMVFSSQAGFTLPNGAVRSPDTSWLSDEQVHNQPEEEEDRFAHICPVFVAEIRFKTDRLPILQAKMEEYMANVAQLGFLIDPITTQAWIYRPAHQPEFYPRLKGHLSGSDLMPGLEVDLTLFAK